MIRKSIFCFLAVSAMLLSGCKEKKTMLFNGKDLDGWVLYVAPEDGVAATDVFKVSDGKIVVAGKPFGYMRTEKEYADYKLHAEWRWIGAATNSGIFQRVQEGDRIWPSVVEVQLQGGHAGDLLGMGGTALAHVDPKAPGLFYKVRASGESPEKPEGEWNSADVEVTGTNVKVWVNGKFVNEAEGLFTKGCIALQSEGGPLEFRNVYIVEK
jgi:hypothetical protein